MWTTSPAARGPDSARNSPAWGSYASDRVGGLIQLRRGDPSGSARSRRMTYFFDALRTDTEKRPRPPSIGSRDAGSRNAMIDSSPETTGASDGRPGFLGAQEARRSRIGIADFMEFRTKDAGGIKAACCRA